MMKQQTKQQKIRMKKYAIPIIGLVVGVVSLTTNTEATVMIGIIIAAILGPLVLGLGIRKKLRELFN